MQEKMDLMKMAMMDEKQKLEEQLAHQKTVFDQELEALQTQLSEAPAQTANVEGMPSYFGELAKPAPSLPALKEYIMPVRLFVASETDTGSHSVA